jgi:hypothetical protein
LPHAHPKQLEAQGKQQRVQRQKLIDILLALIIAGVEILPVHALCSELIAGCSDLGLVLRRAREIVEIWQRRQAIPADHTHKQHHAEPLAEHDGEHGARALFRPRHQARRGSIEDVVMAIHTRMFLLLRFCA